MVYKQKKSGSTFTCSYDSTTGKLTFTETTGDSFSFTFATNTSNTGRKVLGFNATDTTSTTTHTSEICIDLAPHKVMYISLNEDTFRSVNGKQMNSSLVISADSSFGSVLRWKEGSHYSQYVKFSNTPNMLSYKFHDEDFNELDLNGMDWILVFVRVH